MDIFQLISVARIIFILSDFYNVINLIRELNDTFIMLSNNYGYQLTLFLMLMRGPCVSPLIMMTDVFLYYFSIYAQT